MKYILIAILALTGMTAKAQTKPLNPVIRQHYISNFNYAVNSMSEYRCKETCARAIGDTGLANRFKLITDSYFDEARVWLKMLYPNKRQYDSLMALPDDTPKVISECKCH